MYAQRAGDTIASLEEVVVRDSLAPLLRRDVPAHGLSTVVYHPVWHKSESLLPVLNTVPGVRLEERSPGSYRLMIHGSPLRSPFGVRNVKVYLDEVPLTDASGNTYLNLVDPSLPEEIKVVAGPDNGSYGPLYGGQLLLKTEAGARDTTGAEAGIQGGAFGLIKAFAKGNIQRKRLSLETFHGYQQSEGYREQSALRRYYGQVAPRWQYSQEGSVRLLLGYADLRYETPGGLTLPQMQQNPRAARPATTTLPGAAEQNAGVRNRTLLAGLVHQSSFRKDWHHLAVLSLMHTGFANPFITNYETRMERTWSFRTRLGKEHRWNEALTGRLEGGMELQQTNAAVNNHKNEGGAKGDRVTADDLAVLQHYYYLRGNILWRQRLSVEWSSCLQFYRQQYTPIYPQPAARASRDIDPVFSPSLMLSYYFNKRWMAALKIARGLSAPTIEEMRASDQQVNLRLNAEKGWKYLVSLSRAGRRLDARLEAYYFGLTQAIVRRVLPNDQDYYINGGSIDHLGADLRLRWDFRLGDKRWLDGFRLELAHSLYHYRFDTYTVDSTSYSGNRVTGVPEQMLYSALSYRPDLHLYLMLSHSYTGRIPLNDANVVYADPWHLVQARAGYIFRWKDYALDVFATGDNLLDARYSLGNDINAFGGRYYNPAAGRNFTLGMLFRYLP